MKLVFQRPLWLEFTAFSLALMGICGHLLGLWRLSVGLGVSLKVAVLQTCVDLSSFIFEYDSWIVRNLRETLFVFRNFLRLPEWFQFWYSFSGLLELVISTALIVVGVFFWNKRTYAVKAFFICISISVVVHLFNITTSLLLSESLGFMKMLIDIPFLLLKAALIPIVLLADKSILGTHAKTKVNFSNLGYSR